MKHIVSFSGGKDSTAMLLLMIEKNMHIDKIVFVDTTKEFPAMYRHIEQVQEYIQPLKIDTIKIDFDYWFSKHIKTKGKMKGQKGYGFPDFQNRWCTALKRHAVKKIISKYDIQYHGIAADERKRIVFPNYNIKYPLIQWNITQKQTLQYCYSMGFNWDGLYEDFQRVSCWCCPMSRIGELEMLYHRYPHLWKKLRDMDKKSYRQFRPDYSVSELEKKFSNYLIQEANTA